MKRYSAAKPLEAQMRAGKNLILVLAGLFAATTLNAQSANNRRPTLALMNFTNSALVNRADYDPLEWSVPEMITTRLARNTQIELVDRRRLQELLDEQKLGTSGAVDPTSAARIGQLLGARYMVFGTVVIDRRNRMRVDARVLEVETSKIVHTETYRDANWDEDVNFIVDSIAERLNRNLKLPGRIPPQPPLPANRAPDSTAQLAATTPTVQPPTVQPPKTETTVTAVPLKDSGTVAPPKPASRNAGLLKYGMALRLMGRGGKPTPTVTTLLRTAVLETPSLARDVDETLKKINSGAP